jgi:Glycosyl hydrolase family 26
MSYLVVPSPSEIPGGDLSVLRRKPLMSRVALWTSFCQGNDPSYIQDQLYIPNCQPADFTNWFNTRWAERWATFANKERLEINLAMFPKFDDLNGGVRFSTRDDRWGRLIAGEFNEVYDLIATTLIQNGYGSAQIRLGHEFNQFNEGDIPVEVTGPLTASLSVSYFGADRFAHLVNPRSASNKKDFKDAWTTIHSRFMKVNGAARPGANFKWVWSPIVGDVAWDATQCYPGTAYVDIIGPDLYDTSGQFYGTNLQDGNGTLILDSKGKSQWVSIFDANGNRRSWITQADYDQMRDLAWKKAVEGIVGQQTGLIGLNYYYNFAASVGDKFRLSEWGVSAPTYVPLAYPAPLPGAARVPVSPKEYTGGDNPDFIARMYNWLKAHPLAESACYFESPVPDEDGDHSLLDYGWGSANPLAANEYRRLFVETGFAPVTGGSNLLLAEDFADGGAAGFTGISAAAGQWNVSSGALRMNLNSAAVTTTAGATTWSGYRLSADILLQNPWKKLFLLGYKKTGLEYSLELLPGNAPNLQEIAIFKNTTQLKRVSLWNGTAFAPAVPIQTSAAAIDFILRPEGTGLRLIGRANGQEIISHLDAAPPAGASGGIGFRADLWNVTAIDNVKVAPESGTTSPPPPPVPASLLVEDFDDNLAQGWTLSPNGWQVASGGLGIALPGAVQTAYAGTSAWNDYTFSFDLNLLDDWKTMIIPFYRNGAAEYTLGIQNGNGRLVQDLVLKKNGVVKATQLLNAMSGQGPMVLDMASQPQRVLIKVCPVTGGNRIFVTIQNNLLLDWTDTSGALAGGGVGFRSDVWSVAGVDNVSVTRNTTTSPPQPPGDSAPSLSENFDDGVANDWTNPLNKWAVVAKPGGGNHYRVNLPGVAAETIAGKPEWKDYTLRASVRILSPWHPLDVVMLKSGSNANSWRFTVGQDNKLMTVQLLQNNTVLHTYSLWNVQTSQWNQSIDLYNVPAIVRCSCQEQAGTLRTWVEINGQLITTAPLISAPVSISGQCGFRSSDWTVAEIDDVVCSLTMP